MPWQSSSAAKTGTVGLWAGFLAPLPLRDAVVMVRRLEGYGISTIWLQEWGSVDPFIRAALYLEATENLCVALGVANTHARDAEAMITAGSTLESAFPGRFVLGMGVSHRSVVESRGHEYAPPIPFMRAYLDDMGAHAGERPMPPVVLGALGPHMLRLAGSRATGAHSYFSPVPHTARAREIIGPDRWYSPAQMVSHSGATGWRDQSARYLQMCLAMPNYTNNLRRFGFTDDDFATPNDRLLDALVVADAPEAIHERVQAQRQAGADHVVLQLVPPPPAEDVLSYIDRNAEPLAGLKD